MTDKFSLQCSSCGNYFLRSNKTKTDNTRCKSCTTKEMWSNPLIKEKQRQTLIKWRSKPETQEKMRIGCIKQYSKPEVHEKHRIAMLNRYSKPEEVEKTRQQTIERYKNAEERERTGIKSSAYWSNMEAREHQRKEMVRVWSNPEYKSRVVINTIRANVIKPNKPESIIKKLLEEYFPNEWVYNGDGKTIINGKCPDFIHNNGKHLLIEVFGDYFHDPTKNKHLKSHQTEKGTYRVFANAGYRTLILWERDIYNSSNDELKRKIINFMNGK